MGNSFQVAPELLFRHDCRVPRCKEPQYRGGKCRWHYEGREPQPNRLTGFSIWKVYAIRASNGLIKIGISINPKKRLATLRTSSPVELELLGTWETAASSEKILHKILADSRVHGEWFNPTPTVMEVATAIQNGQTEALDRLVKLWQARRSIEIFGLDYFEPTEL